MTVAEHPMTDNVAAARPCLCSVSRELMNACGTAGRWLGAAVETVAAGLVLVEIVILLAGVTRRYVFRSPLIWSDELASILFLWLSMLGAVIALRRGEHMRMTGLVSYVGPGARAFLEMIAAVAPLALLALILHPAFDYASEEHFIVTPALEISNVWRAAAIPVGMTLMAVMAAIRLGAASSASVDCRGLYNHRRPDRRILACRTGARAARTLQPDHLLCRRGGGQRVRRRADRIFLCARDLRLPRADNQHPMMVMVGRLDEGMSHLILLAVPLFIFLGALIEMTGMARAMIQFLASLLGHVRGGLSYVLIGAMYLVSGISGSKIADMAAIAPVLFPEMQRRGAKPGDLVALLAATGAQTETIPPSIVLITIGSVTGVSIAALFTGGLLPALVLGAALCVVVWRRYRHEDLSHVRRYRSARSPS